MASCFDITDSSAAGSHELLVSSFDHRESDAGLNHPQHMLPSHCPIYECHRAGPDSCADDRRLLIVSDNDGDINKIAAVSYNDGDYKLSDGSNNIGEVILSYERSLEVEMNSCNWPAACTEQLVQCLEFDGGSYGSTDESSLLTEGMTERKGADSVINLFSDPRERSVAREVVYENHFACSMSELRGMLHPLNSEAQSVEDSARLREWERKSTLYLEDKERKEREKLSRIIDDADEYKENFYVHRENVCEETKRNNREQQKAFLVNQEIFHATAHKHYWKAVSELISSECMADILRYGGGSVGKDQQYKAQSYMNLKVEGPKPGKATELTRMLDIILKLKHDIPADNTQTSVAAK